MKSLLNPRYVTLAILTMFYLQVLSSTPVGGQDDSLKKEIARLWSETRSSRRDKLNVTLLAQARQIYELADSIDSYQDMFLAADVAVEATKMLDWKGVDKIIAEYSDKAQTLEDPIAKLAFKSLMLKHVDSLNWKTEILGNSHMLPKVKTDEWNRLSSSQYFMEGIQDPSLYEFALSSLISTFKRPNFQRRSTVKFPYIMNVEHFESTQSMADSVFNTLLDFQKDNRNNYLETLYKYYDYSAFSSLFTGEESYDPAMIHSLVEEFKEEPNIIRFVVLYAKSLQKTLITDLQKGSAVSRDSLSERYKRLNDYCKYWNQKHPLAKGTESLTQISETTHKSWVKCSHPGKVYPGMPFKISLEYKNLDTKGQITIYKVKNPDTPMSLISFGAKRENISKLLTEDAVVISQHQLSFNNTHFGLMDTQPFPLTLQEEGLYILELSAGTGIPAFYTRIVATGTTMAQRNINGSVYLYPVDLLTGKPKDETEVFFYSEIQNPVTYSYDSIKPLGSQILGPNGFTRLYTDSLAKHYRRILYKAGSFGPGVVIYPGNNIRSSYSQSYAQILFDRNLYRPGDTIHYKVILYDIAKKTIVNSRDSIVISIADGMGKEVFSKKMTANEFGSASGWFFPGKEAAAGNYVASIISVPGGRQYHPSQSRFRLENHKRNSFHITFEPIGYNHVLGDTVYVKGRVLSHAGFPLSGTTIRHTIFPVYFRSKPLAMPYLGGLELSGSIISDSLGYFTLPVHTGPGESGPKYGISSAVFHLTFTASSTISESNEFHTSFNAGPFNSRISLYCEKHICSQNPSTILVNTYSEAGANLLEGVYSILSLDNREVIASGQLTAGKPIKPNLSGAKSGHYRLVCKMEESDGRVIIDSTDFVVFNLEDNYIPDNPPFFFYNLGNADPGYLTFLAGTNAPQAYALAEFWSGDSLLWQSNIIIKNGLEQYQIPLPATTGGTLNFCITTVLDDTPHTAIINFPVPGTELNRISIEVLNLRKSYHPGRNETITIKTTNPKGIPTELMATIFDKATEKNGPHSLSINSSFLIQRSIGTAHIAPYNPNGFHAPYTDHLFEQIEEDIPFAVGYGSVSIRGYNPVSASMKSASTSLRGPESVDDTHFMRKNFKETLFFAPFLYPGKDGKVNIEFNTSNLLSTFRLLLFAHDKQLNHSTSQGEFLINKDVMIACNLPRFVREGDSLVIEALAINNSIQSLDAKCNAYLELYGKQHLGTKAVHLKPGEQRNLHWSVPIPERAVSSAPVADSLKVRVLITSRNYSDGEEHRIKLLPSLTRVSRVEIHTLERVGEHIIPFSPPSIDASIEHTSTNVQLSNPLEILLAELEELKSPHSRDLFSHLGSMYAMAYTGDDRFDSASREAFEVFRELRSQNGFLSWYAGMDGSYYLSYLFMDKIGEISRLSQKPFRKTEEELIIGIIRSMDTHFLQQHKLRLQRNEKYKYDYIPYFYLCYLKVRAHYKHIPPPKEVNDLIGTYLDILEKTELSNSLMENAGRASALFAWGREGSTGRYLASIREHAIENGNKGYYFPNAVLPLRGIVSNETTAHSQLLNLFAQAGDMEMAEGIARWLILQKENQYWGKSLYITDAVWALSNPLLPWSLGNGNSQAKPSSYTVNHRKGYVTVKKTSVSPEFLYLTHNYLQHQEEVKSYGNDIALMSRYYNVIDENGKEVLLELSDQSRLKPGDHVRVIHTIENTQNRSYVSLTTSLPGLLIPRDEMSGYKYGYYREVGEYEINYHFDLLPDGKTVIGENFIVDNKGGFSTGISIIKSCFVPVYRANGVSIKIISAL